MAYFYISLGAFILYLACKTSYKLGKQEGVNIGFHVGKAYGKALERNVKAQSNVPIKYYTNTTEPNNPDINDLLISKN